MSEKLEVTSTDTSNNGDRPVWYHDPLTQAFLIAILAVALVLASGVVYTTLIDDHWSNYWEGLKALGLLAGAGSFVKLIYDRHIAAEAAARERNSELDQRKHDEQKDLIHWQKELDLKNYELEWQRSNFAADVIADYYRTIGPSREVIEQHTGPYWSDVPAKVPAEIVCRRSFVGVEPSDKDVKVRFGNLIRGESGYELKKAVLDAMNHMELVAELYQTTYVNQTMIDDTIKVPMRRLFMHIVELADEISHCYGDIGPRRDAWPVLTELMVAWNAATPLPQPPKPLRQL